MGYNPGVGGGFLKKGDTPESEDREILVEEDLPYLTIQLLHPSEKAVPDLHLLFFT